MAYYQTGVFSTANQAIIDLAEFAESNGWTIDYNGVHATSYRRLHLHKGEAHFDFYSANATLCYGYGCTGYDPAQAPHLQPGVSLYKTFSGSVGKDYWFVSTKDAIYLCFCNVSLLYYWGVFCVFSQKIGNWSGGAYMQGLATDHLFGSSCNSSAYGNGQVFSNGEWSKCDVSTKIVFGTACTYDLCSRQPNFSNGAILPVQVLLGKRHDTDGSKAHPLGYAPGLYRAGGGDVYDNGDIITIGADSYLILPSGNTNILSNSGSGNFLFKLGA